MNTRNTAGAAETYNDTVVRQFAIMTVVWGIVGMLVGVIVAAELTSRCCARIWWRSWMRLPRQVAPC